MKKVLHTPVSAEDLKDIHVGDVVYLTGHITTCRDVAHRRPIELGRELPIDLDGGAIFHAGPIVRSTKNEDGTETHEMISLGPTTSMRMEKFEKEFIEQTGVKVIVGKGGMGPNTEAGCKIGPAIHCVFPAGCAVLAATEVNQELRHVPYPVTQALIWDAIVKLEGASAACDVLAVLAPTVPQDESAA